MGICFQAAVEATTNAARELLKQYAEKARKCRKSL